jgi:hypothetical protein
MRMRPSLKQSGRALLALALAGALAACQSPPGDAPVKSTATVSALDVLKRLDLTSFRNSTAQSRGSGRKYPADYGYTRFTDDGPDTAFAEISDEEIGWELGLSVIQRDATGIVACFSDIARNGGSYFATSALHIVPDGNGFRVDQDDFKEPSCEPEPGQGEG